MIQAQKVDVGQGAAWIGGGFQNFMKNPGLWIVLALIVLIVIILLSIIPFIGALALSLLAPVFMAGMLYAAREAAEGRPIEVGHLFRGFQDSRALNGLLALGGILVAGTVASMIVVFLMLGGAFMAGMQGDTISRFALGTGGLIGILLVLAIQLGVAIAVVYAIPLVMFKGTPVGEAMSASINACLINFLPLLVFSVIYLVIAIIALLPFGLGLIVLVPASMGMLYVSYRDIFGT